MGSAIILGVKRMPERNSLAKLEPKTREGGKKGRPKKKGFWGSLKTGLQMGKAAIQDTPFLLVVMQKLSELSP